MVLHFLLHSLWQNKGAYKYIFMCVNSLCLYCYQQQLCSFFKVLFSMITNGELTHNLLTQFIFVVHTQYTNTCEMSNYPTLHNDELKWHMPPNHDDELFKLKKKKHCWCWFFCQSKVAYRQKLIPKIEIFHKWWLMNHFTSTALSHVRPTVSWADIVVTTKRWNSYGGFQ